MLYAPFQCLCTFVMAQSMLPYWAIRTSCLRHHCVMIVVQDWPGVGREPGMLQTIICCVSGLHHYSASAQLLLTLFVAVVYCMTVAPFAAHDHRQLHSRSHQPRQTAALHRVGGNRRHRAHVDQPVSPFAAVHTAGTLYLRQFITSPPDDSLDA